MTIYRSKTDTQILDKLYPWGWPGHSENPDLNLGRGGSDPLPVQVYDRKSGRRLHRLEGMPTFRNATHDYRYEVRKQYINSRPRPNPYLYVLRLSYYNETPAEMLLYLEMDAPLYGITSSREYEQDMKDHALRVLRRLVNLTALTDEE